MNVHLYHAARRERMTIEDAQGAEGSPQADAGGGASTLAMAVQAPLQSLEKRRLQCYLALMVGDIVALIGGFVIGALVIPRDDGVPHAVLQAQLLLPIFLTVGLLNRSYSIGVLKDEATSISKALQALAIAALAMALLTYFSKSGALYARLVFAAGLIGTAFLFVVIRFAMRGFVRWRCGSRVENILVVDDGGPPLDVPSAYHVEAVPSGFVPDLLDPQALDRLGQWFEPMDRVIVTCEPDRREAWAMALKCLAVEGEVIDSTVETLGALGARRVGGQGLLLVSHRPLGLRDRALKRLLDLALAVPALVVLAPLMLVIAVLIRLEDGGPALFRQRRTGRASRFITIYNFRSMRLTASDRDGTRSASRQDERVTALGRIIRRTSIDELPQLINVVKGDMSLVGPRPHAIGSQAGDKLFWEVDARYWQRHTLKPGLTGLAQIRGYRGATDSESDLVNRLQADLEYLDGWSILRDLGIIFATLRVIVHDRAF